MIIGCPKERKVGEKRIALTPKSVKELTKSNIEVWIEKDAGIYCSYTNEQYIECGGKVVSQEKVWEADLIIKVKEPQESEYKYFKEGQIIFGFLHLAANPKCIKEMLQKSVTAIAAETITCDGIFNLLKPVSQIAGRRALFLAIHYLEIFNQGKGILLSGTEVIAGGKVLIVGGGEVGTNACDMAIAIGCEVVIAELSDNRIELLKNKYKNEKVKVIKSTEQNIADEAKKTDVLISTILIPGAKAPKVITKKITDELVRGSIVIDVSADQGGSVEILKEVTTHQHPIKVVQEVLYYSVPNMPGAVPKTASESIQGTINYIIDINNKGINKALKEDEGLKQGVQIKNQEIVYENLKKSYKE